MAGMVRLPTVSNDDYDYDYRVAMATMVTVFFVTMWPHAMRLQLHSKVLLSLLTFIIIRELLVGLLVLDLHVLVGQGVANRLQTWLQWVEAVVILLRRGNLPRCPEVEEAIRILLHDLNAPSSCQLDLHPKRHLDASIDQRLQTLVQLVAPHDHHLVSQHRCM